MRQTEAKNRDAKNRDAKNRDAKNRDAKNRDAKNRSRKRERERGSWLARSAAPAGGQTRSTAVVPLEGAGSSFLLFFGD